MLDTSKYRRRVAIDRVSGLSTEIFHDRYLAGSGKPVIVTGALDTWEARSKWTFDFFKSHCGSAIVIAKARPETQCMKAMKMSDFIDYLESPELVSRGFWVDPMTKFPRTSPAALPISPLYLRWKAFDSHPELLEDIDLSPKFVEDWLPLLPEGFRTILDGFVNFFSIGVLIGPRGSTSELHYDSLQTHAYLAQISGKKRCVLFSPDDSDALYNGTVDPDQPDFEQFPRLREATAFECVLEPGELLFIPFRWWHQIVVIEKSITVSYNFFNRVNFTAFFTDILRKLPFVVDGLEASPDSKETLGIHWVCKGFHD